MADLGHSHHLLKALWSSQIVQLQCLVAPIAKMLSASAASNDAVAKAHGSILNANLQGLLIYLGCLLDIEELANPDQDTATVEQGLTQAELGFVENRCDAGVVSYLQTHVQRLSAMMIDLGKALARCVNERSLSSGQP